MDAKFYDQSQTSKKEVLAQLMADEKAVYVKPVSVAELSEDPELSTQLTDIPADQTFYAVHLNDGRRVAIVDSRDAAFAGARQYDMEPYSVH